MTPEEKKKKEFVDGLDTTQKILYGIKNEISGLSLSVFIIMIVQIIECNQ